MKFIYWIILLGSVQNVLSQEQFTVYFASNQYHLAGAEEKKIKNWIVENSKVKIVAINGFTDEDGSVGFNDTLATKRVETIYNTVKTQIAIRDDFKVRSFGKLHDQLEDKSKNRRVTIYYLLEKDLPRENEILGIVPEQKIWQPKAPIEFPKEIILENPNGTTSTFEFDQVFMNSLHQAAPGSKLLLKNIEFVFNTFAVENSSRGKLYELLTVMQQNQSLIIEIQGHICCNTSGKEKLSTERAKAIKNFLVRNGIQTQRITFKGFGATQPIFAVPEKNEQERATNRRVEILVIEN